MSGEGMSRLVTILADGLRVWVKRGEVALTEDQIFERARNQAQGVLSEFLVVSLPSEPVETEAPEWWTPLIGGSPRTERPAGVVPYHGWSCQCMTCHAAKQKERA